MVALFVPIVGLRQIKFWAKFCFRMYYRWLDAGRIILSNNLYLTIVWVYKCTICNMLRILHILLCIIYWNCTNIKKFYSTDNRDIKLHFKHHTLYINFKRNFIYEHFFCDGILHRIPSNTLSIFSYTRLRCSFSWNMHKKMIFFNKPFINIYVVHYIRVL